VWILSKVKKTAMTQNKKRRKGEKTDKIIVIGITTQSQDFKHKENYLCPQ
jgi:hypothetical protein